MVDSEGRVLADIVIRPPKDGAGVVSYLTPLTGLTSEMCLGPDAKSLEEAIDIVKGLLSKDAVLVGQAIDHDVEWLGLVPGKDFERMLDISEIFRQRMPSVLGQAAGVLKKKEEEGVEHPAGSSDPSSDEYLGFATRYRHFSLRHVCLNLLGEDIQSGVHDPIVDAKYSLALFHKYRNSSVTQLRIVRDGLHRAPITPGFAAENTPVIDGVCVSAAGYPYKQAARKIWRWYSGKKQGS
jgi:DNA polymerase III epsilon subunit-like protein